MSTSAPRPSLTGRHRRKRTPRAVSIIYRPYSVANETSTGDVILPVKDGWAYVAVIARRNKGSRPERCLPKGYLEGIGTPEEAVVWGVSEETGIFGGVLTYLASTDYWPSGADHRVHKMVHHFLLEALSSFLTTENDPDQEVEKVE